MKVHLVKKGESLWKIAKMYGVPLESVIAVNPQVTDPHQIHVGMKVNLPVEDRGMPEPLGVGLPGLGHTGVFSELGDLSFDTLPIPEGINMAQYVVQSGDTLWKIAKKTGHSLANIIAANPQIANPDMIMPGQVINIPGSPESPGISMPMNPKEKLTMPKPKAMEVKPMEIAPIQPPAPMPVMPPMPPVPSPVHQEVDLTMLHYHPQYFIQPPPKVVEKKYITKPIKKHIPHPPQPVISHCPPLPVYGPCPPGTFPAIMDECGNLFPYPHHYPMYPATYAPMGYPVQAGMAVPGVMAGPMVGPGPMEGTWAAPQQYFPTPQMTRGENLRGVKDSEVKKKSETNE